jgi:PAS domain S-box-containing protein
MQASMAAGKAFHGEVLNYRKDGSTFWNGLSIVPVFDPAGQIAQFVGVARDISKRREIEETLKKYAEDVEDLYQNAPCGYHSLDRDGVVVRMNETELGWLGYRQSEVIGRKVVDFLSPASAAHFLVEFESTALQSGGAVASMELELELICRDGAHLPVLVSSSVVCDTAGNFLKLRASVQDMRNQKRMEEERERQAARLAAMSHRLVAAQEEIRRRLSADLHDRTSPNLAAISINLGLLASRLAPGVAADIAACVEDTRALIDDTALSIREISAELRPPLIDYAGLLPAMESYAHHFSRRTGIDVRIGRPDRKLRLDTEVESVLFRVFQEALTNCAKHSRASVAEVELEYKERGIVLAVADNGAGFPLSGQAPDQFASGLGLINMKEMVEFVGGRFAVNSQPGQGTRIQVEI